MGRPCPKSCTWGNSGQEPEDTLVSLDLEGSGRQDCPVEAASTLQLTTQSCRSKAQGRPHCPPFCSRMTDTTSG